MTVSRLDALQRELVPAAGPATLSHGALVLRLAPNELQPTVRRLRDEFGFDVFLDVTAVDWPADALRFEVVHHFYSTAHNARSAKTRVADANAGVDRWRPLRLGGVMERECHDHVRHRLPRQPRPAADPALRSSSAIPAQGLSENASSRSCPTATERPAWTLSFPNPVRSIFGTRFDYSSIVNIGPSHPATQRHVHRSSPISTASGAAHRRPLRLPASRLREGVRGPHLHNLIPTSTPHYVSALVNDFAYCDASSG